MNLWFASSRMKNEVTQIKLNIYSNRNYLIIRVDINIEISINIHTYCSCFRPNSTNKVLKNMNT